jgi:phosphoadenosine phosphosulfate reductase
MQILPIDAVIARHTRIGFQFSGGRDSTVALYLLRHYWPVMTIYHLDTGDQFPETRAVVREVQRDVPITVIRSDVAQVREIHGLASDLVPVDNIDVGRLVSGRQQKIISRYECCARAIMIPMHQQLHADGITLLIRGQRDDEFATPPMRSGDVGEGIELLYPVQSWSSDEIDAYIRTHHLPVANFYAAGMKHGSDCMGCTAWWDEGRSSYLRQHHPAAFKAFAGHARAIRIEIDRQYQTLDDQL